MSRLRSSESYDHRIHCLSAAHGEYRVSWLVDRYYPDSRLRHPRRSHRDTDEAGARRFAKRHNVPMPLPPPPGHY